MLYGARCSGGICRGETVSSSARLRRDTGLVVVLTCVSAPTFCPGRLTDNAASGAPSLCTPDLAQSIITLVARRGLIDGLGDGRHQGDRPRHLRLAAQRCRHMEYPALRGRSIFVVEDEVLIGMDIRTALEQAGAHVTATTKVRQALVLVEHDGFAAAVWITPSPMAIAQPSPSPWRRPRCRGPAPQHHPRHRRQSAAATTR